MEHLVTCPRPNWVTVSCEMLEGTSVPQEERRVLGAQGSRCKPAWLGFLLLFAKTSRYCLDKGKVNICLVEFRVAVVGVMEFDTDCRSLGEDPSVTLAVRDGKHPPEISQEWFLWRGINCQSLPCSEQHLPTQTFRAGPRTHLAMAPGAGHCWLRKPAADVALSLVQTQLLSRQQSEL